MTQESRSQECPPEFQWNSTLNKCVDCVPGYYGLQCSKSCVSPFYGVGCQQVCSECPKILCDVSYGCPRKTEVQILTTSLLYITSTLEIIKSSLLGETTITETKSSSFVSEIITTVNRKSTSFIKEDRTTINTLFSSTTPPPSFFNSYYPVLLGILGVCVLFLVIFTIYVSIHIHEKCSKKRQSPKTISISVKDDEQTYQEIHEFDMVGNLKRYDPFIERNALLTVDHSKQSNTRRDFSDVPLLVKEISNELGPKDHEYVDVIQENVVKHTYTYPLKTTKCITKSQGEEERLSNTHCNSPPQDKDGYMLPNTVGSNSVGVSGDPLGAIFTAFHPELDNDNTSSDSENTGNDSKGDYLTVITSL